MIPEHLQIRSYNDVCQGDSLVCVKDVGSYKVGNVYLVNYTYRAWREYRVKVGQSILGVTYKEARECFVLKSKITDAELMYLELSGEL